VARRYRWGDSSDIHEGTMPDATAFKALMRAAAKHNAAKKKR